MAGTMVLGKRKNRSSDAALDSRKRRVLRSSSTDENIDPAAQTNDENAPPTWAEPLPSKRVGLGQKSPAKRSGVTLSVTPTKRSMSVRKPLQSIENQTITPPSSSPATKVAPRTPTSQKNQSPNNVYSAARQLFAKSARNGELVGREAEQAQIKEFLQGGIETRSGRCLYVSGPPGTGKSAFVGKMCAEFAGAPGVKTAYINCMSIKDSKDLFARLTQELGYSAECCPSLKEIFEGRQTMHVVTLDEMDHLMTLDLEVMYSLFELSLNPASSLVLVGIANALDLTDRFLPRLKSRNLRPQLLPFIPYSAGQIAAVITEKLKTLAGSDYVPFLHPAAIQFCAKKVASQTGDLRRAFDLARRAIELIENETRNKSLSTPPATPSKACQLNPLADLTPATAPRATIAHIARIAAAAFNHGTAQRLRGLNLQQKAALCTVGALEKRAAAIKRDLAPSNTPSRSNVAPPTLRRLFEQYVFLCRRDDKLAPLERSEFADVVSSLEQGGLVRVFEGKGKSRGWKAREEKALAAMGSNEDRSVVSLVTEKELEGVLDGAAGDLLAGFLEL